MTDQQPPENLALAVDRCVKCGLCLPDCPTYRLARNESASPRGRLALIEGLLSGALTPDKAVLGHLDSCLGCRRCERVCPSGVAFGPIMDRARADLLPPQPVPWHRHLVEAPRRLRAATLLARLAPPWMTRATPGLHRRHRLARALYAEAPPRPGLYRTAARPRGRVGLFPGCATSAQQGGALSAALRLLVHSGFEVLVPQASTCCGALASHAGDDRRTAELAERNRRAFPDGLDAVISVASGCGVQLDAYSPPLPAPHLDICRFLVTQGGLAASDFAPRRQQVLLHTPCTVENVYRGGGWAVDLLALVPDLGVSPLGEPGQCCGSAGDYLLRHPATADALRGPLLEAVFDSDADVVLTTNIGCALHLSAGLASWHQPVEVLHPVELLARQLIEDTPPRYTLDNESEQAPGWTGETL